MNVAATRAAEGFDRRSFTAHDVRRMVDNGILDEKERTELVEGEFVVLEPKVYADELIKNDLSTAVILSAPSDIIVGVAISVQFTDHTILEPDLIVFKKGDSRTVRCRLLPFRPRQSTLGSRSHRLKPGL